MNDDERRHWERNRASAPSEEDAGEPPALPWAEWTLERLHLGKETKARFALAANPKSGTPNPLTR